MQNKLYRIEHDTLGIVLEAIASAKQKKMEEIYLSKVENIQVGFARENGPETYNILRFIERY